MNPPIVFTSPLPASALQFDSMAHTAGLSMLEETRIALLSDRPDISAEALLSQPVSVDITLRDGEQRHIHGHVTRFGIGRNQGRYFGYEATVRPWLWFLTRTSDCRIYQNQTVQQIVESVFGEHAGIAKYQFKLSGSYRTRDYTVQYRETDFNFVARLLEDEGIYWYFEHSAGQHKLVLVDSMSAHPSLGQAAGGQAALPFYGNRGQVPPDIEYISQWNFARSVETGRTALTSYDFTRPSTSLLADRTLARAHGESGHEQFDYQGDYTQRGDGAHLADVRLDEQQSRHEHLSGTTNSHALAVGHRFGLSRHPREDQNTDYVCVQTQISAHINSLEAGAGNDPGDLHCSFTALPASQQFRPQRATPKPFVQGPQTAQVVGPAGEEIFTDQYGRVKVQFHWDRYGQRNERSSCWVRTSSPWAGKSFGFVQVPRIGQEVVVDFLEGDPDQPLITGRVYNAEQMPPWELPANATQSGVLSRSSKGGAYSHANALRFEDKKGEEQLWLHAEKDQLTEVEHDEDKWVGNDRRKTIDRDETNHIKRDRTETVDRNEKITVHGWRTEEVDGNETITIHSNRTERVDHNETISIGDNRSEAVGINETIAIGANRTETVGANESVTVAKNQTFSVGDNRSKSVGSNEKDSIGKNWSIKVGKNKTETITMASMQNVGMAKMVNIGAAYSLNVGAGMMTNVGLMRVDNVGVSHSQTIGKTLSINAGESIELVCGESTLKLTKDGKVTINGKEVLIVGTSDIKLVSPDIHNN